MRWQRMRRSGNVEDRRGAPRMMVGGGLGTIVLVVIALMLGVNPARLINPPGGPGPAPNAQRGVDPAQDELADFVSAVLASTEDVWQAEFQKMGERPYPSPTLVLFTDRVESACGFQSAAVGPFYCPADRKVYIDLGFYRDLAERHGAPGDFAQAYVIAHEVGHHVQNVLGISDQVHAARGRMPEPEYNQLLTRLELQADFLAGLWAHHAQKQGVLEPGDVEEALGAASAIGDDRLQREARGYVVPDSFTHGTSAQRTRWFRRGLETGDFSQGDTFNAQRL